MSYGPLRINGAIYVLSAVFLWPLKDANAQVFTDPTLFHAAAGMPEHVITFDDLPHDTTLTSQYSGIDFSGTARTWDASQFGGGGTAFSFPNVLFNFGTAPMRWTFVSPARSIGVYNPSLLDRIRLRILRADNSEIATIDMDTGFITFAGYIASEDIAAVEAAGIAGSSNFTIFLDNLEWSSVCPEILETPGPATSCSSGTGAFTVTAGGASPLNYQWEIQTPTGTWAALDSVPIPFDCPGGGTGTAFASEPFSPTTSIGVSPCAGLSVYEVRCVVNNMCGNTNSEGAAFTVFPAGGGDGNGDDSTDGLDISDFVEVVLEGGSPSIAYCAFDMNADGVVNTEDTAPFIEVLLLQ